LIQLQAKARGHQAIQFLPGILGADPGVQLFIGQPAGQHHLGRGPAEDHLEHGGPLPAAVLVEQRLHVVEVQLAVAQQLVDLSVRGEPAHGAARELPELGLVAVPGVLQLLEH